MVKLFFFVVLYMFVEVVCCGSMKQVVDLFCILLGVVSQYVCNFEDCFVVCLFECIGCEFELIGIGCVLFDQFVGGFNEIEVVWVSVYGVNWCIVWFVVMIIVLFVNMWFVQWFGLFYVVYFEIEIIVEMCV